MFTLTLSLFQELNYTFNFTVNVMSVAGSETSADAGGFANLFPLTLQQFQHLFPLRIMELLFNLAIYPQFRFHILLRYCHHMTKFTNFTMSIYKAPKR